MSRIAILLVFALFPQSQRAATFMVEMTASSLTPADLTINQGDIVVWISGAPDLDTVSYTGEWKSPVLLNGEMFSYTFQKPGSYVYGSHAVFDRGVNKVIGGAITVLAWTNTPPAVTINAPVEGFYFTRLSGVSLLASTANREDMVRRVDFFANDGLIGSVTNAPYQFQWFDPAEGQYALAVRVTDSEGGEALSRPVHITVEFVPDQRAHLWGMRQVTNGVFAFHYNKGRGPQTCVRTSDDLKSWCDYGPAAIPVPGTFVDEAASGKAARFYWIEQCFGQDCLN